jgi:hypothetical protein
MSMLDALIAQIQAAPDDDALRLAWANAVGGERGELVIVQCRLASGPVTDHDEWRRLRARERELLVAHGVAWSGLAGEYPSSCMFRRGFVESAGFVCSYDSRLDGILARLPLARSMSNDVVNQDDYDFAKLVANPRSSALAALQIDGDRTIQRLVEQGVAPRALHLSKCSRASAKLLADSGLLANVERLVLRSVDGGGLILSATTRLRALSIDALDAHATEIPSTVVELACGGGLEDVAKLSIAPTLERLLVRTEDFTWDFEPLMSFEALRSLDLAHAIPGELYRPIAPKGQRVLPALRELSLSWWFEEDSVESAAKAFGRQLETLHWTGETSLPGMTRDTHRKSRWRAGLSPGGVRDLQKPLVAGDAHIGAHVAGEFVVGFVVPWAWRPLEFGDDGRGPWFEGGGVAIHS